MLRQVVDSSSLHSIGYDKSKRLLEVKFRSGAVYVYAGVPTELWNEFRDVASKGKFFQERIRDSFTFEKA